MKYWCISMLLAFSSFVSCNQVDRLELYDKNNYYFSRSGPDEPYKHVKIFLFKKDTAFKYKELYFDSTYKSLVTAYFFSNGNPNGPFFGYVNGHLNTKGVYKDGRHHGKIEQFKNGRIVKEYFYEYGKRIGILKEYDTTGKLIRRIYMDEEGNISRMEDL